MKKSPATTSSLEWRHLLGDVWQLEQHAADIALGAEDGRDEVGVAATDVGGAAVR